MRRLVYANSTGVEKVVERAAAALEGGIVPKQCELPHQPDPVNTDHACNEPLNATVVTRILTVLPLPIAVCRRYLQSEFLEALWRHRRILSLPCVVQKRRGTLLRLSGVRRAAV